MTVKQVTTNGLLKDVNDNFAALAPVGSDYGVGGLRVARFRFDASAGATAAAHSTGVTIPANAIICGGFLEVLDTFTDGDSDAATIAVSVQAANDIVTATAISAGGNIWDKGRRAIVPKANTPESTGIKVGTAAKAITVTVAGVALTAGILEGYLYFVEGSAPA